MRRLSLLAVLALLLSLTGATAVRADSGHRDYQYVAGAQPLCDIEPSACPDVARASNGDTIGGMNESCGCGTW